MAVSCSPASSPIPAATPAAGTPARWAERAILIPRTAARAPAPATMARPALSAEPAAAAILQTPCAAAAAAGFGDDPDMTHGVDVSRETSTLFACWFRCFT